MPFKCLLDGLVKNVPGAMGAIVADWEGEAVDQVGPMDEYELKVVGAHSGVILQNVRESAARLKNDDLQEIVVITEKVQTLVLPVNSEYYLVLTFEREDFLGRALFEARRCLVELKKEIC